MEIEVVLLGTGVGIPVCGRVQAGLVVNADLPLIFDFGAGALFRMNEAGFSPLQMDSLFLSHLHLDHVADVLPLAKARYLLGEEKLDIFGPSGTERWFFAAESLYPYLELDVSVHELASGDAVFWKGFKITAAEAIHSIPALGYRVERESRSIVYSGDTEPSFSIAELARGGDLLIHECSFPEPYRVTNHTTPKRLGEVLKDVKRIVLTHLYPQTIGHEEEMVRDLRISMGADIPVEIGHDLQRITL
jgi:ribonuclease Z